MRFGGPVVPLVSIRTATPGLPGIVPRSPVADHVRIGVQLG